jgi:hypothetical protein
MGPFTTLLHSDRAAPAARASCEYVLSASALFVGCTSSGSPVTDEHRAFAGAVLLYRVGRRAAAYDLFVALAARGHVRSARIALAMQGDGATGGSADATAAQLLEWEHTAGGEPTPQFSIGR